MVESVAGLPQSTKAPPPTNPVERLQAAEKLRQVGNAAFKAGDLASARTNYESTLKLLQTGAPPSMGDLGSAFDKVGLGGGSGGAGGEFDFGEGTGQAKDARLAVLLNIALCCLKAEPCDPSGALGFCEEALDLEPDNVKATYRKGKALIELNELKEAEWELARALRLAPQDPAIRKDLTQLRRDCLERRENEKKMYEGLFARGPGFASDGREEEGETATNSPSSGTYEFLKEPSTNVYASSERPYEEALALQSEGKLEDAIYALEAAVCRSSRDGDWPAHFSHWLELGRSLMDLNFDALALRCLNKITDEPKAYETGAPATTKKFALLLRAICLLNEAEDDPKAEVSNALAIWFAEAGPVDKSGMSLNSQLEAWRSSSAPAGADAAVAHALLHLVYGRDEALQAFADAITSAESADSFFGDARRQSTRWNMLGAVLANRGRHEHALLAYKRSLHYQAHYPRAFQNRGIAAAASGDHVAAVASYAAALEIVPEWASPPLWSILEKEAKDEVAVDGLVEAAEMRYLSKVKDLIRPSFAGFAVSDTDASHPTDDVVLSYMGFSSAP